MFKPDFSGGPPTMFRCGNDGRAKKSVTEILNAFGRTVDIGGVEGSRLPQPRAMLWIMHLLENR